jgi:hypothetical protein
MTEQSERYQKTLKAGRFQNRAHLAGVQKGWYDFEFCLASINRVMYFYL